MCVCAVEGGWGSSLQHFTSSAIEQRKSQDSFLNVKIFDGDQYEKVAAHYKLLLLVEISRSQLALRVLLG